MACFLYGRYHYVHRILPLEMSRLVRMIKTTIFYTIPTYYFIVLFSERTFLGFFGSDLCVLGNAPSVVNLVASGLLVQGIP